MMTNDLPSQSKNLSKKRLAVIAVLTFFFFSIFVALGVWQLYRLQWKLALVERVNTRIHASVQDIPAKSDWGKVDAHNSEYLHVRTKGHFLNNKEALVYASTEQGPGYWVLTPLQRDDGTVVFINRGFVPLNHKDPKTRAQGELVGEVTVIGLLRLNEPGGTLLRSNDIKDDRWYSRDVLAMGKARGLSNVAPFFIDADATANPGGLPVGGLTVVKFRNSHLSYAFTWFAMAALSLVGGYILLRIPRRRGT